MENKIEKILITFSILYIVFYYNRCNCFNIKKRLFIINKSPMG